MSISERISMSKTCVYEKKVVKFYRKSIAISLDGRNGEQNGVAAAIMQ